MSDARRYNQLWNMHLTGPLALLNELGETTVTVEGIGGDDQIDRFNLIYRASELVARVAGFKAYDDMPERFTPAEFAEPEPTTNEFVTPDGGQQWFVTVYSAGRSYGGPEEGGWYFDCGELVRQTVVNSVDEAEALRDRLREEFPHTGKRYSVLGGSDYDIRIGIRPGPTDFPEEIPHYE